MKSSMFFFIFLAAFAVFSLPGLASADVDSVLYIQGPGGSVLVNTSVVVLETCTVQDSIGVSHSFSGHKAICALQAAKAAGIITDFEVTDAGFGFSLDSINGISNAPDWSELWQLWQNGSLADVGIQGIVLAQGDDFQLTYGPWITGIISMPHDASGGPVITDIYPQRLRVEDAVSFLVASQQDDGSFGHVLFTDWVAVALGAYKGNSSSAFYAKNELVQWLKGNPIPEGSALTDFERRAMALMALGINPYTGSGVDYIQAIVKEFDGTQFGNMNLVNDDIFALLVLARAGYQEYEEPVANALQFVLASQRENGSWGDADMSAAAVQMLDLFSFAQERNQAIAKAKEYLEGTQENTGGFGNVYSTSWVLQAISAMQENGDSWVIDDRTPEHFLALRQALDGGLLKSESKENRIWATSYAIPAALGKSWGSILVAFEKPPFVLAPLVLVPQVSLQEELVVSPVAQENEEFVIPTIEDVRQQIAFLQQEVAALGQLEHIQTELNRIALEIKAVEVRIVAFKVEQLAQNVGQPRTESLVRVEDSPVQIPSQALSGITLVQEEEEAVSLAAEAREIVGSQGLSPQLIILLVIIGGAVFVYTGGMNAVLPLLRRTFSRI